MPWMNRENLNVLLPAGGVIIGPRRLRRLGGGGVSGAGMDSGTLPTPHSLVKTKSSRYWSRRLVQTETSGSMSLSPRGSKATATNAKSARNADCKNEIRQTKRNETKLGDKNQHRNTRYIP